MKATQETKDAAKAAGIKSWHVKSEETLQEELAKSAETTNIGESDEYNNGIYNNSGNDGDSGNLASEEFGKSQPNDAEEGGCAEGNLKEKEELTLPTDITPKLMLWSIKAVGKKSKYWKYKHLLG